MNHPPTDRPEPSYRIGAVARLTGVAPDTLRVWERRHGAVVPFRSAKGSRLYSQQDVARLALIKRLVDSGDAISRVANLSMGQLQERAKGAVAPALDSKRQRPCRVAVLGDVLAARLKREPDEDSELEILGFYREKEEFLAEVPKMEADVAVLEYTTIHPEQIRDIGSLLQRSGVERALVVYGFATQATLDRLESPRVIAVRAPLKKGEFRRWCHALHGRAAEAVPASAEVGIDISGPLPARRFDEAILARIAAASVSVRCECPHHMVDLISSLAAFESYSAECEVRSVDDAALHAFLHTATAHARALLEAGLARVIEADGIDV
jgi:DNA-binding transcriptional MerR regulator